MNKHLKLLFLLALSISIFSCKKDDDVTPNNNNGNTANTAPVANADNATTTTETAITINLLSNDTDAEGDNLSITTIIDPSNGSVVNNEDGTITYTPDAAFTGTDSFNYTISDGEATATATVTITINEDNTGGNTTPVANDDTKTTPMGEAVSIDVLANDTDTDGDALTITETTNATNGSISTDGSTVSYTPDALFIGTETITYTISDGTTTATATLTITVGNSNQTATYEILSPYFGIEVAIHGNFNAKLIIYANGTFSQKEVGPLGYSDYDGIWNLNEEGKIVFEEGVYPSAPEGSIHEVSSYDYCFNGTECYEGFALSTAHNAQTYNSVYYKYLNYN